MVDEKQLSDKREVFCQEYLVDLNATQAAIRAGYSPKTAQEQSSRLLLNVIIQDRITELMAKRSERTEITADSVIQELALLGFSNMGDYATYGNNGVTLTPSNELTRGQLACLSEVSERVSIGSRTTKFKLHDKKGSLELLGRHLELFTDKVKHDVSDTLGGILGDLAKKGK